MLLATDLDGTFLGGKSLHKQQLYQLIRENRSIQLVYVTGRGLESVIPLLNDPIIPNPDYIICDVGATVVNGNTLEPVDLIQSDIEKKWPGDLAIMECLQHIEGVTYQQVPQQRRCSFLVEDEKAVEAIRQAVAAVDCEIIYSASKFLDILPRGVDKGSTLGKLIALLGTDKDEVLVAGDTLNDLAMFQCGFKGVVVGNPEPALAEAVSGQSTILCAAAPGAGGILEALNHFPAFANRFTTPVGPKPLKQTANDTPQLIMMYHRFPYEVKEVNGRKERIPVTSPNGILPTLQNFFSTGRSGVWIAWEEIDEADGQLRNIYIDKERYPHLMAARVGLTRHEVEIFYKSFSKEAFWPTIFAFADKASFNHHHWDQFVNINRRFAEKAAEQADMGAVVWIHDYNLWLVPGLLRQLRPDLVICFFHHTAFPAANTFNILPWRREIIGSLLQCNFVGFHIPRYVENFVDVARSLYPVCTHEKLNCAPRFLTYSAAIGVDQMTPALDIDTRTVRFGAIPVGINVNYINKLFANGLMHEKVMQLKQQLNGKKMILSAERLDYVKGPMEKVLAFEAFLEEYPEFHGQLELVNFCTPPAAGMKIYDSVKLDLEQAVGRINAKFGRLDWTPVRLFLRALPFEEIVEYYAAADIAWITPLRDGLNLVAKEYIAAQGQLQGDKGVLVLSEFAGAAVELPYAVLTNPYDPRSLRDGLLQALTMSAEERNMRMERLFNHVRHYDIDYWAEDFLHQALTEKAGGTGSDIPLNENTRLRPVANNKMEPVT